jgi:hypothetical protein
MKVLALLCLAFASQVYATVKPAPVDQLFVPSGFDSNDNVQIVVIGRFPDTCHTRRDVQVKINQNQIHVTVNANYVAGNCEKIEVPFKEDITIGQLQAGTYKILVNGFLKDKLSVDLATSDNIDDHIYAIGEYIELGYMGGLTGSAWIVGRMPDCLKHEKNEYISNGKDTISILPIMKRDGSACTQSRIYREIPIKFEPMALKSDKVLLFVRTLDGKSINTIIEK